MKQTKEQLLSILADISAAIQADDSFEGSLSYTVMAEGLERGEFEVEAVYRIGNSEGQGGMVLIRREAPAASAEQDPQSPSTLVHP